LLNHASAGFAFVAAILWLVSATFKSPTTFQIDVAESETMGGGPAGAKHVGSGQSEELETLGRQLRWQSRFSAAAAVFAAVAAILQGIGLTQR
jgi:hypothetical protein